MFSHWQKGPTLDACPGSGLCYRRGAQSLGFITLIISGNKPTLCPGKRLPHPLRLLATSTVVRNGLGDKQPGTCLLSMPNKNVPGCSGLRITSSNNPSFKCIQSPTMCLAWSQRLRTRQGTNFLHTNSLCFSREGR